MLSFIFVCRYRPQDADPTKQEQLTEMGGCYNCDQSGDKVKEAGWLLQWSCCIFSAEGSKDEFSYESTEDPGRALSTGTEHSQGRWPRDHSSGSSWKDY